MKMNYLKGALVLGEWSVLFFLYLCYFGTHLEDETTCWRYLRRWNSKRVSDVTSHILGREAYIDLPLSLILKILVVRLPTLPSCICFWHSLDCIRFCKQNVHKRKWEAFSLSDRILWIHLCDISFFPSTFPKLIYPLCTSISLLSLVFHFWYK